MTPALHRPLPAGLVPLEEARPPPHDARRIALFDLGFRPFYLLAAAQAALSIVLWAAQLAGWLPHAVLAGPAWHAHEMTFGFALAVIVGFLFTAGRNWSGQPTPHGAALAALAALWLAARVLVLTPWPLAAALANVAFPLAAAAGLARAFARSSNRRNDFFVALLVAIAAAAAAFHAAQLGWIALRPGPALQLALGIVLFVVAVMAGRVIPMFTNNGVPQANATRRAGLERLALGSVLALPAADLLAALLRPLPPALLAALAAAAALAHAARWWLWQPWKTLRTPLVWVLHLAYLWIPVYLALRALGALGLVAPSLAVHALTVGAIGGMVIGMMTRTARGHTARPLVADRFDVACYVLVAAAAFVRVLLPAIDGAWLRAAVIMSASLWSAGFALYALRYAPFLIRPRLDGRAG